MTKEEKALEQTALRVVNEFLAGMIDRKLNCVVVVRFFETTKAGRDTFVRVQSNNPEAPTAAMLIDGLESLKVGLDSFTPREGLRPGQN